MNAETKRTVRFALIFGFFLGGLFGWTLNEMFDEAGAEGELEWYPSIEQPPNELAVLNSILREEIKQTALLDHIDCLQTTKYFKQFSYNLFKHFPSSCGQEPLNLTGVWKDD